MSRAGYEAARTGGDELNPATPRNLNLVRSYHPASTTSLQEMNGWVDRVRREGGWLVIGVHGIADPERPFPDSQEGWEPVPVERYVGLVDHIAAAGDRLWVAPFGEVARYIRARDAASARTLERSDRRLRVRLAGLMDGPAVTFETEVPADWVLVNVSLRDGDPVRHPTWVEDGVRRVRYLAAPPAEVNLSPAALRVVD